MLIASKPKHLMFNNAAVIHASELDIVIKCKYLGAHVDNNLDWKELIKTVST